MGHKKLLALNIVQGVFNHPILMFYQVTWFPFFDFISSGMNIFNVFSIHLVFFEGPLTIDIVGL